MDLELLGSPEGRLARTNLPSADELVRMSPKIMGVKLLYTGWKGGGGGKLVTSEMWTLSEITSEKKRQRMRHKEWPSFGSSQFP